jgi:SAM-dependent methyltransferase
MTIKDMHSIYPISWILKSAFFVDFVKASLNREDGKVIAADFASGEHDRVPSFFIDILPDQLEIGIEQSSQRLDSLLGKIEESKLLHRVRMVQAKLESLDEKATIRPGVVEYLERHLDDVIWLDDFLIGEERFPPECVDIGVLNNDVIGYLHEYYKSNSNLNLALEQVWKVIRTGGLLVVTMPCSLYVVDNITALERVGFTFEQGIDITLANGDVSSIKKNTEMRELSQIGHYSYFVFSKRRI